MNKKIFDNMIQKPPQSSKAKYVFLSDNKAICEAIVTVGFRCVYIDSRESEAFFDAESFCARIKELIFSGTNLTEYIFVPSCFRKRTNDQLGAGMKVNQMDYITGAWSLFRAKEYLGKYEYQDELEKILYGYVSRHDGPDELPVDKEQFIKRAPDGSERGVMEKALVDYIIETVCFFVVDGAVYIYHDGVYREDLNGIEMKSIIQSLLYDKYINFRTISGIYRLLVDQWAVQKRYEELNAYPAHWINFRNGFFDVKEFKLYKHHPKYLAINQIPHELNVGVKDDMDAAGPETIRFLENALPDPGDRMLLYQFAGYCMTRDTCIQKFLILKGAGGTGKSRIISMIQNMVGTDNVSGMSMEALTQRFYPAQLRGKLLNACADIKGGALTSVDIIKAATGEDLLVYERKGRDPTTFRSYAKLLFSANEIPINLDEKSDALYRRMLILVMDRKPEKEDRDLDEKLQQEVDYLIWKGIAGLRILYQDGNFRETERSRQEVEKLHRAADTVKAFMDECTERQQGSRIRRKLLYETYCEYCKGYGRRTLGQSSFYRRVEEMGYQQKRSNADRLFLDISLLDEGFLDIDVDEKLPFNKK